MNPNYHETIRDLIQKSLEIFSQKGYAATNLVDITDALGISRGPIYYHFKDKLGLYNATFDYFDQDVRESHAKIIEKGKPFIEFVEDVIFDCVERNTVHGPSFFFGIDSIPELKEIKIKFDRMNQDIYQEKIDYVNQSKLKGEIRQDIDPKQVADMIYIVYNGALMSVQNGSIKKVSEPEVRELIRVLISGIDQYCKVK